MRIGTRAVVCVRKAFIVCLLVVLAAHLVACSGNVNFNASGPAGGGPVLGNTPRESLVEKDLALQEQATSILSTVQDQPSLKNARLKLTALVDQHKIYKQDLQKLGPMTLQESTTIRNKFGDRSKTAKENMAREMTRVNSTIPGGNEVYVQLLDLWQGL